MTKVVSKRSLAAVEDNKTVTTVSQRNCTGALHEHGSRQRKAKRASVKEKTNFECDFRHVCIRGQREVRLTSFCIRVKRNLKFSIPTMLALVVYLIERWFASR